MDIALFITCFNDTLFPDTGKAMVRLLERLGHHVDFPFGQTCCGQMHINSGYHDLAIPLIRRFVEVFDDAELIVAPSSSCVTTVRVAYRRLAEAAGDAGLAGAIDRLAPRVLEMSEFLTGTLGLDDVGAYFPHRVAYHPTCNSLRGLGVGDAPLRLLRHVRGIELVPLGDAEQCCGFGGTFAVKNAETSTAMLADKMRSVLTSRAEVLTALDNSCLMHIGGGLSRLRGGVRVMHLAEILAEEQGR